MADAAYSLFFVAILLGGASFIHVTVQREWRRIQAALNGERFEEIDLPATAGNVRIWERPQPILEPVTISICRL